MGGTVLYDSECRFCTIQAEFISNRDARKSLRLVPLQAEEGRRLLKQAGMAGNDPDTLVYQKNGRYFKRSDAVLHIFRDMGGGWRLLYGFIVIPAIIRDFFYNLVARNRHRLVPRNNR